jgi:hypothetical protein
METGLDAIARTSERPIKTAASISVASYLHHRSSFTTGSSTPQSSVFLLPPSSDPNYWNEFNWE